jgi:transcriptional regulator with GAF, ATPase, and Fis domain
MLEASLPELALADQTILGDVVSASAFLTEKEMREFQKNNLLAVLKQTNWRVSGADGAAELLGVKPTTLADRIRTLGIRKPQRRQRK